MIWWLTLPMALLLAFGVYRARCAWAPFTTRGRRRLLYWRRTWWAGDRAQNRDDY